MSAFMAVLQRDLQLALRRKSEVLTAVFFFVVVATLFPLAIGPEPEQILNQVRLWAAQVAAEHPGLERVTLFGSYGRGDAGVGSDLDLLLIDTGSSGPQHQRLLAWPLAELPLSCDALVLTPTEHAELLASGSAMASSTRAKAPASVTALASASSAGHSAGVRPWVLKPPSTCTFCGVMPIWAITGMPRWLR